MPEELKGMFVEFNKGNNPENDVDRKYRLPRGGVEKLHSLEEQYNLPKGLLLSVSSTESGGEKDRASATSPKGAKGWFQFIPETAKAFNVNPRDFNSSAEGAAKMFSGLNKQYDGDLDKMLVAYNWGSGNIAKHGMEKIPKESKNYLTRIKARLKEFIPPQGIKTPEIKTQSQDVGFPMNILSPSFKKLLGIEEAKVESPDKQSSISLPDIPESLMQWAEGVQNRMKHPIEALAKVTEDFANASPEEQALQLTGGGIGHLASDAFLKMFPDFAKTTLQKEGQLIPLFHGTSKDKPFTSFKESGRGIWLTSDPKSASQYAVENDAMTIKYNFEKRAFEDLNTSARVIPVYANVKNPYKPSEEEFQKMKMTENYAKAQKILMEKAKKEGYDAIDYGGGVIAVASPKQLQSTLSPK
ncbi:hypothetical protein [Caudoviricetes sp.]|nr:hypothetical protein [Caudoviricetes sp.]